MQGNNQNWGITIVVGLVMLLIGGVGGYFMCSNSRMLNPPVIDDRTPVIPDTSNFQEEVEEEKVSYVGDYGYLNKENPQNCNDNTSFDCTINSNKYDPLHLRSDGTFLLALNSSLSFNPTVGTYTLNNDNTITLKEVVKYDSNSCFYTNNLKTYTLTIVNSKTLSLINDNKIMTFEKGKVGPETEEQLTNYVTNPIPGQVLPGKADVLKNCTYLNQNY